MRHLDADALRALAAREPDAVAYFQEHLAAPCDACEEFLAQQPGPDLLDGQTDALLLALAPRAEAPLDEVGYARLRKRMKAPAPHHRWLAAAAALAACVLGAVVVTQARAPVTTELPGNGIKGSNRISLELAVVARGPEGNLRRLDSGSGVPDADVLLLRYHATEAGTALLFQQSQGGPVELLGRFSVEAGTHDLAGPQGLAGVSLAGESGPLALWLVGFPSGEEPSPEEVRAALEAGGMPSVDALSVARFDVHVQNGHNPR
ncbi:hypothetical protein P2318_11825 [Myxococcaceae bacterium GXIMD 01537]